MGSEVLAATRTLARPRPQRRAGLCRYRGTPVRVACRCWSPRSCSAGWIGGGWIAWRDKALGRPLLAVSRPRGRGIARVRATFLAGLVRAGDYWRAWPLVPYLAVYTSALAAMLPVLRWLDRGVSRQRLRIAAWLLILLVGGALSLFVPGAMIFFILGPGARALGLSLAEGANAIAVGGGHPPTADVRRTDGLDRVAADRRAIVGGCPTRRTRGLALPGRAAPAAGSTPWSRLPALLAVGLWIAALTLPRASAERPLAFTIDYVRDDDRANRIGRSPANRRRYRKAGTMSARGNVESCPTAAARAGSPRRPCSTPRRARRQDRRNRPRRRKVVRLRLATGGANAVAIRFDEDVPMTSAGLPGALVGSTPMPNPGPRPCAAAAALATASSSKSIGSRSSRSRRS